MKVMADGLPGGTSFMEDYTYHLVPGEEKILGAHMLEVCPSHHRRRSRRSRSTRSASAAARTRSGWASPPTPGPASSPASSDLGDRFRLTVNEVDVVEPDEDAAAAAGGLRGLEAPAVAVHVRRGLADGRRARTTPCSPRRSGVEVLEDFAEMTAHRAGRHRRRHHAALDSPELRWNAAYYRLAQRL